MRSEAVATRPYSMTCPHCAKTLKYASGAIGKTTRCPGCGKPVTVPSPENRTTAEASLAAPPSRDKSQPPNAKPPDPPREQTSPPELPVLSPESPPPPPAEPDYAPTDSFSPPVPIEMDDLIGKPAFPTTARQAIPIHPTRSIVPIVLGASLGGVFALVLLAIGLVYAINNSVNGPLQKTITTDSRNAGIEAKARYGNLARSILVYDLKNISANNSRADVFRVFLQYAAAVKDKQFDTVQLAWQGKIKFIIDGAYFQKLGREFDSQNPVYTIRTFAENLRTPTGTRAFPEWEGGMLGVLKAQMDDFTRFHDQWYWDDLKRSL